MDTRRSSWRDVFSFYFHFYPISKHDFYDLREGEVGTDDFLCGKEERLDK